MVVTEEHLLGLAGLFRVETEVHSLDEASPDCIPCEKGQPEHSVTRQESTCHLLKLCGILRGQGQGLLNSKGLLKRAGTPKL